MLGPMINDPEKPPSKRLRFSSDKEIDEDDSDEIRDGKNRTRSATSRMDSKSKEYSHASSSDKPTYSFRHSLEKPSYSFRHPSSSDKPSYSYRRRSHDDEEESDDIYLAKPRKPKVVLESSYGRKMARPVTYREDALFSKWDDPTFFHEPVRQSRREPRHEPLRQSSRNHRDGHDRKEHLERESDHDEREDQEEREEDLSEDDEETEKEGWQSRRRLRPVQMKVARNRRVTRSLNAPPKEDGPFRRTSRNSLQTADEHHPQEYTVDEESGEPSNSKPKEKTKRVDSTEEEEEETPAHDDNQEDNYRDREEEEEDEDNSNWPKRYLRPRREMSRYGRFRATRTQEERKLRKKNPVNYSKQLMPRNFEKMLEAEADREKERMVLSQKSFFGHLGHTQSSGSPSRSGARNRLNEDDDDGSINLPQGRVFALFGGTNIKGGTVPVNMAEILQAEENLLMKGASQDAIDLFHKRKLSKNANTQVLAKPIDFNMVAGLDDHIRSLKEMVGLPLMYPEVFENFNITPPRGVLFHGPPGTGKTLMARALASTCSTPSRPVAFFMRKGADILSKWVGESEKQLRILFEQAKAWQPSIIFFDEIDGLAPVRSSKQDQIHSSVVSTLLALMDGLDSRGQVVVIGATNRIDAIDPALRRPGRFDREFYFGLPETNARRKMIDTNTSKWSPPLNDDVKDLLADASRGYNGADMKALCTEAALTAVRRTYPQIYDQTAKMKIRVEGIHVQLSDFLSVLKQMTSSTERSSIVYGKPLPNHLRVLFPSAVQNVDSFMNTILPVMREPKVNPVHTNGQQRPWIPDYLRALEPRLLICGAEGMGQDLLGADIVSQFEGAKFYVQTLDVSVLSSLVDVSAESQILQAFHEAKRHRPSLLFLPHFDKWWTGTLSESIRATLEALLYRDRHTPPVVVATCTLSIENLPPTLLELFSGALLVSAPWKRMIELDHPKENERREFFNLLLSDLKIAPLGPVIVQETIQQPIVEEDSAPAKELSDLEVEGIIKEYEKTRRSLRQYFGSIIEDLKKAFKHFSRPVDRDLHPDFQPDTPMDLSTMEDKVQKDRYETPDEFLYDVCLIVDNTEEFNDPYVPSQKEILLKARKMRDAAMERVQAIPAHIVSSAWSFYVFSRSTTFEDVKRRTLDRVSIIEPKVSKSPRRTVREGTVELSDDLSELSEHDVEETLPSPRRVLMRIEETDDESPIDVVPESVEKLEDQEDPQEEPVVEIEEEMMLDQKLSQEAQIENMFLEEEIVEPVAIEPVIEIMEPLVLEITLDESKLTEFVDYLARSTTQLSVIQLEEIAAVLASTMLKYRDQTDRDYVLTELEIVFEKLLARQ